MRSDQEWLVLLGDNFREAIPSARVFTPEPTEMGADLVIESGDQRLLVLLELVRGPRIPEVEGQLARAVLKLKRCADEQGGIPVPVVALTRYGPKLEQAVRSFMEEFAPGVGWGLLDERGQAVLMVPGLDLRWSRAVSLPEWGGGSAERGDRQLFTDLNRWLLKVLLLVNAPDKLWGGPRQKPRHPTELAGIARVSVAKAHSFARAFEGRGFLRKSREGLKLTGVQEMLQSWLQDEKNASPKAVPVRALIPPLSSDDRAGGEPPLPESAWDAAVVGGAFAALKRGLLRVGGRQTPLVHVRIPISRAIQDWQLEECDPRDAQMVLSRPLFPQSVFLGQLRRQDGPPLVDLWQVALD